MMTERIKSVMAALLLGKESGSDKATNADKTFLR